MFTGIIEEIGTITLIERNIKTSRITVAASLVLSDTQIGDSIAVNGTCLTVTEVGETFFCANMMNETYECTTFAELAEGTPVNLERALTLQKRLGGHIVTGHVDGVGTIRSNKKDGVATILKIHTEPAILRYIVQKGSVALDGVSLTVVDVDLMGGNFRVSLIPHTKMITTLNKKRMGANLNIECDVFAKYIERFATQINTHTSSPLPQQDKDDTLLSILV